MSKIQNAAKQQVFQQPARRRLQRVKAVHHEIFRFDHENVFNPFATMPERHPFLTVLANQQNQTGDSHV
jgi:hypothetical protein